MHSHRLGLLQAHLARCLLPKLHTEIMALQVKPTEAQYTLRDPQEVLTFLSKLVDWGQTDANAWHQTESCIGWALNTAPVVPAAQDGTHAEAHHVDGNGRDCVCLTLRATACWLPACSCASRQGGQCPQCCDRNNLGQSGKVPDHGLSRSSLLLCACPG